MKPRDMRDLVWFDDDDARTEVLFETERIWSQLICLQGSQGLGPISDAGSDAIVSVLAGEVAVQIGKSRTRMSQWHSALVPAGTELTIRNASEEPAVVQVTTAPPPSPAV
ncbi:MAG: cupin domain-containing protein [Actinomycetota bacterium]|nr:cupin domain-containing protein [Actinomycetota bacterium]MDH5223679.1 cupin domain-containing protein [Actinomycetota bacterium]MDH5312283.1 cupin domain-containing protein [Actinomycetota bacterium]